MATATATKIKPKLIPLGERVIIKPIDDTDSTQGAMRGGLYIPDSAAKERLLQGEVIAVGPGRIEKGERIPMELKVGDRVIYAKYAGTEGTLTGEELVLMKESDVYAKLA